jgi:hypothetical protein
MMILLRHAASRREEDSYNIFVRKPAGKRPVGRPRSR